MSEASSLPIVDGRALDPGRRAALRPGELVRDDTGQLRRLPVFFYEVASWQVARETELAPNFGLWEFIEVDLHEAAVLRAYPRYVPCAVHVLASMLSVIRQQLNEPMRISANGGFRSPSHARSREGSIHCWGTAVNICRVGEEWLDTQASIERVCAAATRVVPALWARPYGERAGFADDHAHLDLGFSTHVPRMAPGEERRQGVPADRE
jgi:hypothetical protein